MLPVVLLDLEMKEIICRALMSYVSPATWATTWGSKKKDDVILPHKAISHAVRSPRPPQCRVLANQQLKVAVYLEYAGNVVGCSR
jgi:hypothetical protein